MAFSIHNHFIDKIAFINGVVSGIALYPQVWKVFIYDSAEGLSLVSFGLIFLNSCVWFLYSIHRSLLSLAIASFLNMFASGLLVVLVYL